MEHQDAFPGSIPVDEWMANLEKHLRNGRDVSSLVIADNHKGVLAAIERDEKLGVDMSENRRKLSDLLEQAAHKPLRTMTV